MLLAACNPCPCGRTPSDCECAATERARYHRRLSGPLLDRIDLVCQVSPPPALQLVGTAGIGESSDRLRERVVAARERQLRRLAGCAALCNGGMDGRLTRRHAVLRGAAVQRLMDVVDAGGLTGRGHDRVLRLARTIADLDGREEIVADDLDEALGYRLGAVGEAAA
jgi:magnesium chelatase family protein